MVMNGFLATLLDTVIDFHNGRLITTPVAIVGSREHSHDTSIMLPLVSLHHQLMSPRNKKEAIDVGKLFGNVLSKGVSSTPWRNSPTTTIVGIGPDQIAHGPLVRDFLDSVKIPRMIQSINGRRQSPMKTEYAFGNHRRHWQVVKGIREMFPDIGISILPETLIIKPVHLGNLTTLVVSTQNGDTTPVSDFERNQQRDGFQRVIPSVNVIPHKEIVGIRTGSPNPKQFCQIIKLAMNVTAYCHWCLNRLDIGFLLENFLGLRRKTAKQNHKRSISAPDLFFCTHKCKSKNHDQCPIEPKIAIPRSRSVSFSS
mmetsp:Transcript_15708/g.36056  ORF Transcript_15708/g.36056 Transcript_15708/m.36056 type:complete len:312 (-) Transcript_15708:8-943(-)